MSRGSRFAPVSARAPSGGGRRGAAPLAASLAVHSLLLAWVVAWYDPAPRAAAGAAPPPPRAEVVYLDFPASLPYSAAGTGPSSAPRPPLAARRENGEAPRPAAAPRTGAPSAATPGASSPQGAAPVPAAPSAAGPRRFGAGTMDPRLYVDFNTLPPPAERPVKERMQASLAAAVRADSARAAEAAREDLARRQITVLGRRITVGGDSAAAGFRTEAIERRLARPTMPGDGVMWERLQLSNQQDRRMRDSIFQERVRATRRRNEAERGRTP